MQRQPIHRYMQCLNIESPELLKELLICRKNEKLKIIDAVNQLHASRSTDDAYLYNLDI